MAALFVAIWSPAAVLAAPAGLVVDRLDTRKLLAGISILQAALVVAPIFADPVWATIVLTALLGSAFAIAAPAEFSLVPAVAGDRLGEANGYVETARYVGFTAGPLLGGFLAGVGGTSFALLVNALSFVAIALVALRLPPRATKVSESEAPKARARDGIVYLFRDRVLGLVIAVAFVSLLLMTASAAAEVFFATDVLEVGETGFGALMTSWAVGMALGAADARARARAPARARLTPPTTAFTTPRRSVRSSPAARWSRRSGHGGRCCSPARFRLPPDRSAWRSTCR